MESWIPRLFTAGALGLFLTACPDKPKAGAVEETTEPPKAPEQHSQRQKDHDSKLKKYRQQRKRTLDKLKRYYEVLPKK